MENSIENMWKEGFLKSESIKAPVINNLYNKKSKHVIDKMMVMFKWNLLLITGFAAGLLIVSIVEGFFVFGLWLSTLFLGIAYLGKIHYHKMEKIDKTLNIFAYLQAFDAALQRVLIVFTRVYRYFYPLVFVSIMIKIRYSEIGLKVMEKWALEFPDGRMVLDFPLWYFIGNLVVVVLAFVFAPLIYKWDIQLVYGPIMKKLKELIADMEELNNQKEDESSF